MVSQPILLLLAQDDEEFQMPLVDHMHPRRAPLKREQWGHRMVPGQPAFPTPAASRSEDAMTTDTGVAHPGVGETSPLCIVNALSKHG